jgi:hypothetical protein
MKNKSLKRNLFILGLSILFSGITFFMGLIEYFNTRTIPNILILSALGFSISSFIYAQISHSIMKDMISNDSDKPKAMKKVEEEVNEQLGDELPVQAESLMEMSKNLADEMDGLNPKEALRKAQEQTENIEEKENGDS